MFFTKFDPARYIFVYYFNSLSLSKYMYSEYLQFLGFMIVTIIQGL